MRIGKYEAAILVVSLVVIGVLSYFAIYTAAQKLGVYNAVNEEKVRENYDRIQRFLNEKDFNATLYLYYLVKGDVPTPDIYEGVKDLGAVSLAWMNASDTEVPIIGVNGSRLNGTIISAITGYSLPLIRLQLYSGGLAFPNNLTEILVSERGIDRITNGSYQKIDLGTQEVDDAVFGHISAKVERFIYDLEVGKNETLHINVTVWREPVYGLPFKIVYVFNDSHVATVEILAVGYQEQKPT